MDRVDEQRLIAQAQAGHPEAFSQLYRHHVQAIYRYIHYRVNDAQLAEDLTGDVFIKVLEGLPDYQDRGKPWLAWLYRIAHARVVDHYRRRDRQPENSDLDAVPLAVSPDMDAPLLRQEAIHALRRAITALTADQQQVVVLRFIEGYRIKAIAELMDRKPNAIKALQHRALRALSAHLTRAGFDLETILAGLS